MSQDPKQIWQRLSTKEKEKILIELISICREITNEKIKINKTTNNTQGKHRTS